VTALRTHRLELALLAATTVAALAILWLVDTQIYTEPWTLDPWLYTGLMTNFGFTYYWFHSTYYAARLPLIMPGVFLNSFLTPEQAYVVLHVTLFLLGGVFLYLLARSLFGARTALFVYPAYLTNAIYVNSHTWDYVDGAVITFLSGGLYFLVSAIGGASRMRPALAGFFFAAAATTNLFATLLVFAAIVVYLYGRWALDRHLAFRNLAVDAVWFSLGCAVLLGVCGWFARSHHGRFLFFMPSINAIGELSTRSFKLPTYSWMRAEPRLLVPLFVAALAAIAWQRRGRGHRSTVGLALIAVALGLFLVLVVWEFALSGTFLQLPYYFSMLYPFFLAGLATGVFAVLGFVTRDEPPSAVLAALGLFAGAAPLVAIYGFNRDDLWGRRGSVITLIAMGATLVGAVALRLAPRLRLSVVFAPLVAALALASVNYASDANATTHEDFETHNSSLADADEVFAVGVQLIDFMRRDGLQDSLPGFWYDASADTALTGIQSLYFWGFTWMGLKMPIIDKAFRSQMMHSRPKHLILLCTEPTCRHAPEAVQRAGYRVRRGAARRLHSGAKSIWVRAYVVSATPTGS
jgi:hypothetical protein